jgi:membrane fusion protein (multidrug efflux system)
MFQSQETARIERNDFKVVPAEHREKKPLRRNLFIAVAACAFLCSAFLLWRWLAFAAAHETTNEAIVDGHVYSVTARVPGIVSKVLIDNDKPVNAGDLLVQLDGRDYEARMKEARAALESARAQAASAAHSVPQAEANYKAKVAESKSNAMALGSALSAAQFAVRQAETGLAQARQQLAQSLAKRIPPIDKSSNVVSRVDSRINSALPVMQPGALPGGDAVGSDAVEAARSAGGAPAPLQGMPIQQRMAMHQALKERLESERMMLREAVNAAQNKLNAARQALSQVQTSKSAGSANNVVLQATRMQIDGARTQATAAQAAVTQAQAALQALQLQMSYLNVSSPASGTVQQKSVEVGQRVQPGQPLFAIVQPGTSVVANFSEAQSGRLRRGQVAEIRLSSLPTERIKGHISAIMAPVREARPQATAMRTGTGNDSSNTGKSFNGDIVTRVPVTIEIDPDTFKRLDANRILPGMSAAVDVFVR